MKYKTTENRMVWDLPERLRERGDGLKIEGNPYAE